MRTTVITGGGSGIGRAIALRQAIAGDHVVLLEQDERTGAETVEAIGAAGGVASLVACDVGDTDAVRVAFDQIDRIDALVNNAGLAHIGNVEQTTPDDLDRLYRVNVKGVYHMLHFAVQRWFSRGAESSSIWLRSPQRSGSSTDLRIQ